MQKLCLTAGVNLPDLLWAACVLPPLRRALPGVKLAWECPRREVRQWLKNYSELDEVVADVEEMAAAPDIYRILHPFWTYAGSKAKTPLEAVFELVASWCSPPDPLPGQPYLPELTFNNPDSPNLPQKYVVLDPRCGTNLSNSESAQKTWMTLIAYLSLPTVQIGSKDTSLFKGLIDARGFGVAETAKIIRNSRILIGGDSESSCLAGALRHPQIWIVYRDNSWWWPRGKSPECSILSVEVIEKINLEQFISLTWESLGSGGDV